MTNVTLTIEQAARQALEALEDISDHTWIGRTAALESITALREALDHSTDTGNMTECRHCGFLCKPSTEESRSWYPLKQPKFIPVGIVNDHHSIDWMEEIVEDQAPIGAILYALQDGAGRNVSFADESVCNWRQPTYDHFDANYWDADCGKSRAITEGTPTENGMNFCHGCGKPIKEHPFVDSEEQK